MFTPDEVAGIIDLFGALPQDEAMRALSELAYRRGDEVPDGVIEDALSAFTLVGFEHDGKRIVAPGPAAFPELPDGAEDLPHILDTDGYSPDRDAIVNAALERLRTETACVSTFGDAERAAALIEVSYDLEAWGGLDVAGLRETLDTVRDGTNY